MENYYGQKALPCTISFISLPLGVDIQPDKCLAYWPLCRNHTKPRGQSARKLLQFSDEALPWETMAFLWNHSKNQERVKKRNVLLKNSDKV